MSKIEYSVFGAIEQRDVHVDEFRLAFWFLCLTEVMAWHENRLLRGVSITKKENHWQMVTRVTALSPRGEREHQVAITKGHDIADCIKGLATLIKSKEVPWLKDKYA